MRNHYILKTGLIERLEELHKQFPACAWLQEIEAMNEPEKVDREPGKGMHYLKKGTYYIYKSK